MLWTATMDASHPKNQRQDKKLLKKGKKSNIYLKLTYKYYLNLV